jgi:hypothetical protein
MHYNVQRSGKRSIIIEENNIYLKAVDQSQTEMDLTSAIMLFSLINNSKVF